jgi:hypothetical protein
MKRSLCRRVRLNRDGYDDSGTYWGVGKPLWLVTIAWRGVITGTVWYDKYTERAPNREAAYQLVVDRSYRLTTHLFPLYKAKSARSTR